MNKKTYEKFFSNFSNRTRLEIVGALMDGPLSVNKIVEKLGIEQSNVSHNLGALAKCKIVNFRKDGKQRIYSLNKRTVKPMLSLVESHISGCGDCASCGMCFGK